MNALERIEKAYEYREGVTDEEIAELISIVKDKDEEIKRLEGDVRMQTMRAEAAERRVQDLEASIGRRIALDGEDDARTAFDDRNDAEAKRLCHAS